MTAPGRFLRPLANHLPDNAETLSKFITVTANAFNHVSVTRAFAIEYDKTPPPYSKDTVTVEQCRNHCTRVFTNYPRRLFLEAGNWSAVSLWEAPDYSGSPLDTSEKIAVTPLRTEWKTKNTNSKIKYLSQPQAQQGNSVPKSEEGKIILRPFYYLHSLSRNPTIPSVPGAVTAVVQPYLERARNEGVPAWLEAASIRAVEIYESWGFRVVEVVKFGEGAYNADGFPEDGGEGFAMWFMIYDAHLPAN